MIIGVLRWGWVEVILRVSLEVILRKLLRHLDSHPPGRGLSEGVVRGGRQGPCQELYDLSLVVWWPEPAGLILVALMQCLVAWWPEPAGLVA